MLTKAMLATATMVALSSVGFEAHAKKTAEPCAWRVVIENSLNDDQPKKTQPLSEKASKIALPVQGASCEVSAPTTAQDEYTLKRTRTISCEPADVIEKSGNRSQGSVECGISKSDKTVKGERSVTIHVASQDGKQAYQVSLVCGQM